ncbi:MAG: UDP-N-acetylenolpyruvoylglucosamine reductase [candidate division Zixibacteria bacterium 4484_93]|nr:MAG: UDP-N-acetylenolpyruvoylglucosamine reductase [candidate division Zixibacteria bacterium 4484_93]
MRRLTLDIDRISRLLPRGRIFPDELLSRHTSFGVGGRCSALVLPSDVDEIVSLVRHLTERENPFIVIGNGTNLLVSDKGYEGVVIKLADNLSLIEQRGEILFAQSGASLSELIDFAIEHTLSGLEKLAGIPGTVGGAAWMNAGAYGVFFGDRVTSLEVVSSSGEKLAIDNPKFSYRTGFEGKEGAIVTGVYLKLTPGDKKELASVASDILEKRRMNQPLDMRSAGCIFKNPPGDSAGRIIDWLGLKGKRVGGAQVSPVHANFIVNTGNATASDIYNLIKLVRSKVFEKTRIALSLEVVTVGKF